MIELPSVDTITANLQKKQPTEVPNDNHSEKSEKIFCFSDTNEASPFCSK